MPADLSLLLALAVAVMAAWVGTDLALRVRPGRPVEAARWLAAAGVGLGSGLWAAAVLALQGRPIAYALGVAPTLVATAWVGAVACSGAGLALLAGGRRPLVRAGSGVLLLVFSCIGTTVFQLLALGLRPGIDWRLPTLLQATALAGAAVLAGTACAACRTGRWQRWMTAARAASAVAAGAAVVAAQALLLGDAGLDQQAASSHAQVLPLQSLVLLAEVGVPMLLLVMGVASYYESRLRGALVDARTQLQKQAFTDPLTELPNRLVFEGALVLAAQAAEHKHQAMALMFVNLDGFKPVNEAFGHQAGDRMLREMAQRLRSTAPPSHTVARLGADEFLVLCPAPFGRDEASALAAQLLRSLSEPLREGGREASISSSIGVALYPEHGATSVLIGHAEAAMRSSKAHGGAAYCFYEARMSEGAREQADLLRDLRQALAKGQLALFYQPKIDGPSGEITGAEALLRWHHPQRGLISPGIFVPIAERFGLIGAIGNWVIDEACRQIGAWREQGLRMRVAINLSVHQLRHPDLPERIASALARHHVNPKLLTCEITETVAMEDAEGTIKLFARLAEVGVSISIDDFGTGYSSLAYLRRLPAEELKIDRSFVLDLQSSADARSVVDAVVKLAQALNLKVVAEGVETEDQRRILQAMGCDQLQGFLFAKPMAASALALWAMNDIGPRRLPFRDSLFKETVPDETL